MSRRARGRAPARQAKAFADFDFSGPQYAGRPAPVSVAARPAAGPLDHLDPMAGRILAVLADEDQVWAGDALEGYTTGRIANRLRIWPESPERDMLNHTLTELRRRGLVHFEFDRAMDTQARWTVTEAGVAARPEPA